MAGAARLYMGELRDAQRDLELSSQGYRMAGLRAGSISHFNGELQTRSRQAEVLWLLGFLDQAALTCDEMLRDTLAFGTDSICFAALMYPSIPMAIHMKRDSEEARRLITVFTQYHSRLVSGWGRAAVGAYEAVVDVVCDGAMCSLPKLATAISGIRAAGATVFLLQFLGILAEGLGRAGRLCEARAAIEEALALAGAGGFLWWLPELRRIKAGLIRISNTPFADASAENWYRDAIDCARRQDSLWLELRGAIGLVELSGRDGRIGDARDILASVYGRFTEGFDFHDLRRARALLAAPGDTAEERQVIPSNCLQTAP
jgi:hypothetical protein